MSGVVAVIILVSLVRFIQKSTHILDLSGAFRTKYFCAFNYDMNFFDKP
jgi:hypothetical protein